MNNKELTELKREFDKTFPYLFSSCDGREGYDAEVTQDVWSFFLPHLTKSNDEIKREAVEGFVEEYKKWLVFIPREYDRESIKNSLAVTTDRYLTQQSLDKGDKGKQ